MVMSVKKWIGGMLCFHIWRCKMHTYLFKELGEHLGNQGNAVSTNEKPVFKFSIQNLMIDSPMLTGSLLEIFVL